jgi:acetylornithine/succinyldiaminopimelate/putrescine aminotransferase
VRVAWRVYPTSPPVSWSVHEFSIVFTTCLLHVPLPVSVSHVRPLRVGVPHQVNQGHCHPKIVAALVDQASTLNLTSRAFYNDQLGAFSKYVSEYFTKPTDVQCSCKPGTGACGHLRVLPMNSGAEAVETALKLARKWAYEVKKVPANSATIIVAEDNFHGRTTMAISLSTDPDSYGNFGPMVPNIVKVRLFFSRVFESVLRAMHVVFQVENHVRALWDSADHPVMNLF